MPEPSEHECTNCGLHLYLGSYHGGTDDCTWILGVYCRECGTPHSIERPLLIALAPAQSKSDAPFAFTLRGPSGTQDFISDDPSHLIVSCQKCGAAGQFGAQGPLTDEWPRTTCSSAQQFAPHDPWTAVERLGSNSIAESSTQELARCPRCHTNAMYFRGYFIT